MPIFELSDHLSFPPPHLASKEGVLAVGGDLSAQRLLLAYSQGIFPWPHEGYPLLWFCPEPRFVLKPQQAIIHKSLQKNIHKNLYRISCDTAFQEVMQHCAQTNRPKQKGTWITPQMIDSYLELHENGIAHSVEAFEEEHLVGGLYGISLGGFFFGESMFALKPNASKIAFATLLAHLIVWDFELVDCQSYTEHLARFGAKHYPRSQFLKLLKYSLETKKSRLGNWNFDLSLEQILNTLRLANANSRS